jgi:hypothetical protein
MNMENFQFGKEGAITNAIEEQISKIPSDMLLWTSLGSLAVSLILQMTGRKKASRFIWQWAAPVLVIGLYNKLVKVGDHDDRKRSISS